MAGNAPGNYEVLGAVKIKDGVFIGDELAAQDLEFVVANKVTHVINCCGRQVPNHWEPIGVVYLTYYWVDNDSQIILDNKDVIIGEISQFIEDCLNHAESVLIHSVRGQSRSCTVLCAYMMKKYNWTLRKTMEFLMARRPDFNLKPSFLQQLSTFEGRLQRHSRQRLTSDWNDIPTPINGQNPLESEELLLRNTFMNSHMNANDTFSSFRKEERSEIRLVWADNNTDDKSLLEQTGPDPRAQNMKNTILKSILKFAKKKNDNVSLQSRPTTASSEVESYQHSSGGSKTCWSGRDDDMVDIRDKPISAWEEEDPHHQTVRASFDTRDHSHTSNGHSHTQRPTSTQRMPSPSTAHKHELNSRIKDDFSSQGQGRFLPGSKNAERSHTSQRYESPSGNNTGGPVRVRRDTSPKNDRQNLGFGRSDSPLRLLGNKNSNTTKLNSGVTKNLCIGQLPPRSSSGLNSNGPVRVSNGVMGAYRSGPVKAKVDILGDKRQRPATAPSTRPNHSRPASPLGVCRQSSCNSRPQSPSTRPTAGPVKNIIPSPYPASYGDGIKQTRSLAGHMRRAPSPTPAFNRTNSPGKPRWRM